MVNSGNPATETMLKEIYEKIANKDLSFGCQLKDGQQIVKYIGVEAYENGENFAVIWDGYRIHNNISLKLDELSHFEIIGHPIMISDVLGYFEKTPSIGFLAIKDRLVYLWKNKRSSIESQSDECIEFLYQHTI